MLTQELRINPRGRSWLHGGTQRSPAPSRGHSGDAPPREKRLNAIMEEAPQPFVANIQRAPIAECSRDPTARHEVREIALGDLKQKVASITVERDRGAQGAPRLRERASET